MATTEALRKQISQAMPEIIDELTELVAIPSVAFAGHDLAQLRDRKDFEVFVAWLRDRLEDQVETIAAQVEAALEAKGQLDKAVGRNTSLALLDTLQEIRFDLQPVERGEQGTRVSIPLPSKVRPGDRVYLFEERTERQE